MSELQFVSRILAVRLARLGDVTLLLPSLGLLKRAFPDARLTLLTGLPNAPLAELCPSIDEVLPIDRVRLRDGPRLRVGAEALRFVRQLRARRFDLAIDFQGFRETNLIVWASGARHRIGIKPSAGGHLPFCFNLPPEVRDESLHVGDLFPRVVRRLPGLERLPDVSSPTLRIPESRHRIPPNSVVLSVGASVASRRWPPERFAAVAAHLVDQWSASVLVLSGVTPEERVLAESVTVAGNRGTSIRRLPPVSLPDMVSVIAGAGVLVSNDSGPMHVGSALGVPTLGIFSEGPPHHYRPLGPKDRFIHSDRVEEVETSDVIRILEEMRAAGLGRPEVAARFPDRRPES